MRFFLVSLSGLHFVALFLVVIPCVNAQQKPLMRHFVAPSEEHYQLALTLKAESHSVTTETVAAQTYVTPVIHSAEASVRWRVTRRILSAEKDGSAEIEEMVGPLSGSCAEAAQPGEKIDELQASLKEFCAFWSKRVTVRYNENQRGLLHETVVTPSTLAPLGEGPPQLLALWLRRAARPNVIFPELSFEVGAKSKQSFHPAGNVLKNAQGTQTAEWLDSESDPPGATLHTVQQLVWNSSIPLSDPTSTAGQSPQVDESFFADSLTAVTLEDGSVRRASRTASRTAARRVDPVPGLPQPPDFSSKLTLSVTIERLP